MHNAIQVGHLLNCFVSNSIVVFGEDTCHFIVKTILSLRISGQIV